MLRTAFTQSLRFASKVSARAFVPASRSLIPSSYSAITRAVPSFNAPSLRLYSASTGLARDEVEGRIMSILSNFDKVQDSSKLNNKSHFSNDLGLDSLDTVEVVMAIEEEFSIEIPDKEADAIHSIDKAVEYILAQPDAH